MARERAPPMKTGAPTLHVIIACHNRCELTVRAASAMVTAAAKADAALTITVFDDGSTDGTADALHNLDLDIDILRGDGSAFWARGMALAEAHVLANPTLPNDDLILWLNDDVDPDPNSVRTIVDYARTSPDTVLVCATNDPSTRELTYSGMSRAGLHPLRFATVPPLTVIRPVDTFNGNLVAVPVRIARQLGGIDGEFSHALADIDYGLRCGRRNIPVILLPGTHGTCPRNSFPPHESTLDAWRKFVGIKGGGHFASIQRILYKSNPHTWWLWIGVTYTKWWITRIVDEVRK